MGGNALAEYGAQRVTPERYEEVRSEVLLTFAMERINTAVPYEMPGKLDYGDVDILYTGESLTCQRIFDIFGPDTKLCKNGHVISFLYEEVQVDMIHAEEDSFNFHYQYLSYGDRGMIIGRLARSLGYIFGHDGLFYKDGDRKYLLTTHWGDALNFLGYRTRHASIATEEQLHEWLMSSDQAWRGFIDADSENRKKRKRDRLRPSFKRFMEKFTDRIMEFPEYPPLGDAMSEANAAFPAAKLAERIDKDQAIIAFKLKARAKFNGNHIRELLDLDDLELGEFMRYWVGSFDNEEERLVYIDKFPLARLQSDTVETYAEYIDNLAVKPDA